MANNELSGYELSRKWFDFCFQNPEIIKPVHTALYFFCIEHCNRLGWKEKFGLPTTMAKEAIGIHSYNTYINTLNDLVQFGFILLIQKSKNQFSSNIIALSNFDKALDKALDKATIKHVTKQHESTSESIDSVNKPLTNKPINQEQETILLEKESKGDCQVDDSEKQNAPEKEKSSAQKENPAEFKRKLIEYGFTPQLAEEWMLIRKKKKAINSDLAFENFIKEVEKCNKDPNEVLQIVVNKQWKGLEASWIKNISIQNFNNNGTGKSGNYQNAVERAQTVVGNLITNQNLQPRV